MYIQSIGNFSEIIDSYNDYRNIFVKKYKSVEGCVK